MEAIFFLIRLPFFFLGVALYTFLLLFILAPLYIGWVCIVLPSIWFFLLPFEFIGAAFKNDFGVFSSHIEKSLNEWGKMFSGVLSEAAKPYGSLIKWLIEGGE